MGSIDLVVVGPGGGAPGGVARFVEEQRRRLPEDVSVRLFDNRVQSGDGFFQTVRAVTKTLFDALRFPLRPRPDVVHVHTSHRFAFYRASWYILVASVLWRRPVVVHVHGSQFESFVDRDDWAGRLQSLVFEAADRVIALSEHWSQVLSERVSPQKVRVVPNAVDPDDYDPEFGGDPPRIAFVSNHVERKGVPELVTALQRLEARGREFEAEIAGDGPLSHRVRDLADNSTRVQYQGFVDEGQKRSLLERSDVYVLPTHAEGLPIALLEGMAAGNAVVSTAVGAIPEVIDHETGRLVRPGDPEALTDALEELLSEPARVETMGRRNRARVIRDYSWSTTVDKLTATYRSLTEELHEQRSHG